MSIKGILLDIEGTTSSISFVYEVMFPYVRENLFTYLSENWDSESLNNALNLLAVDAGFEDGDVWHADLDSTEKKIERTKQFVISQMDADIKATGLKDLQGKIWKSGFESGAMKSHLYPDVRPAIENWVAQQIDVRIYSSGSVAAQLLFFGHTIEGNLLAQFSGHYDTKIGSKKECQSYQKIASEFECEPNQILFVSDVVDELNAAQKAELQTRLSIRPGNKPQPESNHQSITSFDQISIE